MTREAELNKAELKTILYLLQRAVSYCSAFKNTDIDDANYLIKRIESILK